MHTVAFSLFVDNETFTSDGIFRVKQLAWVLFMVFHGNTSKIQWGQNLLACNFQTHPLALFFRVTEKLSVSFLT